MDTRDTLLLSCGSAEFRASLRPVWEDSFNLLEADNMQQTKMFLQQNLSCIAAVILNITGSLDPSILCDAEFKALLTDIPLVLIADKDHPQAVTELFEQGAIDVYPPHINPDLLRYRVHNIIDLYRHKQHLQDLVDEQAAVLRHSNDAMVDALSSIIEHRSVESGQHILRIRRFTQILLEELVHSCPEYKLTPTDIRLISSASALHDIGKIAIPDAILNKPGKLTAEEWSVMQSHAIIGCHILETLGDIGDPDYLRYAHNICHYHHERWDGNGYPEGLTGDDIPICAQVVGLADVYDALTNKRVYKEAFSCDKASNMILNSDCGIFSPKLLECFKHVAAQFAALAQTYTDDRVPKSERFDVTLPPPMPTDRHALQEMQTKYQTLLHYANAAVTEVDLDLGTYHLLYNPDPNLLMLRSCETFADTMHSIQKHILTPTDQEHFYQATLADIPSFFRDRLHRRTYPITVRDPETGAGIPYELTLLRLDPAESDRRRMLIVWKKAESAPVQRTQEPHGLTLEQYQLILSQTENVMFDWDLTADTALFSRTFEDIFGYSPLDKDFFKQLATQSHVHPDDVPRLLAWTHDLLEGKKKSPAEIRVANNSGRYLWCRFRATVTRNADGKATHILGILTNITAERAEIQELRANASRDPLTRLYNKQAAREMIQSHIGSEDTTGALLIIDLDNFKQVNDLYGHMFGDTILTHTANELKKLFRSMDIVARIGGDEFLVFMRGIADQELIQRRCEKLIAAVSRIAGQYAPDCALGCSIGAALSPVHGTDYQSLFLNADHALYQSKALGKNQATFYDNKNPIYQMRRQMATVARTQIDSDLQPGLSSTGIVQQAFHLLSTSQNILETINDVLALIGHQVNVSRVYIFENNADNTTCSNTFEWCNDGIAPEIDNLQNISYETDIPNFESNFNEQGIFYCANVADLPDHLRDILEPQGIKSLLHCAIRDSGTFRGYIGFDDCNSPRLWTREQIETLTFFCEMLSTYLLKERAQAELAELRRRLAKD